MNNLRRYLGSVTHKAIACILVFNIVFIDVPIFAMEQGEEEDVVEEIAPDKKETLVSLYVTAMAMEQLRLVNPKENFEIDALNPSNQQEAFRYKEALQSDEWTDERIENSIALLMRLLGRDSQGDFQQGDEDNAQDGVELGVLGEKRVLEIPEDLEDDLHICKMYNKKASVRTSAACCGVVTLGVGITVIVVITVFCILGTLLVCVAKQAACPDGQTLSNYGTCLYPNGTVSNGYYLQRLAPEGDCLPVAVATLGTDVVVGTGFLVGNGVALTWCCLTGKSAGKRYNVSMENVIKYTDMRHLPQIFRRALANGLFI